MLVNTECGGTLKPRNRKLRLREMPGFSNPRLLEAPAPSPLVLATKAG